MSTRPLTAQQETVLTFIKRFVKDHGFPPTLREIGDAIGLSNINAVRGHLAALQKKGRITKAPDKARSIQLVSPPSAYSRAKRKLHEVLGTDEGVFHRVVYGLAWSTRQRIPCLTGQPAAEMRKAFDREAVEHGWTMLDTMIEPDHVVVVVETWPNHSAQRTIHRLQSAGNAVRQRYRNVFPEKALWGPGYAATTDLEILDELVAKLLDNQKESANGG